MSKKYFAKYLPVEGEIKEGDDILYKNGDSQHYAAYRAGYYDRYDWMKKVKLFLCSRDIQVGDTFYSFSRNTYDTVKNEAHISLLKVQSGAWVKPIGEISPEATWVKEGDEFDEYEGSHEISRDGTYIWTKDEFQCYKVKCSKCNHFH